MKKKDWFWVILVIALLILTAVISGAFYFNIIVGGMGTGHVILDDDPDQEPNKTSDDKPKIPVVDGNVIFKKVSEEESISQ